MIGLFRYLLRSNRPAVIATLGLSVVAGATSAGLIALVGRRFAEGTSISGSFVGLFVALTLVAVGANVFARRMLIRLVSQQCHDLRQQLARRFLSSELETAERLGPDRILATMVEDVRTLTIALSQIPVIAISLATIGGCLVFLGWFSIAGLGLLLLMGIAMLIPYIGLRSRLSAMLRQMYVVRDELYEQMRSLTVGVKELKMDARLRRRFFDDEFEPTGQGFRKWQNDVSYAAVSVEAWAQAFFFFFLVALLYVINLGWIDADVLGPFAVMALYLRSASNQMTAAFPKLVDASSALERIDSLALAEADADTFELADQDPGSDAKTNRLAGHGLTYSYSTGGRSDGFSLGPIDFAVESGQVLMVTGGNGSGKTTLAKVMSALYPAESGTITFNDQQIEPADAPWYRDQISAVFASPYFFRSLLPRNDEGSKRSQSLLTHFKLTHLVSDDGDVAGSDQVSTGENKRLALVQAFLADRPIFLFDEWAANQDPSFKEFFYKTLLPELTAEGKIVIVISHDEKYFELGDHILKIEDGKAT